MLGGERDKNKSGDSCIMTIQSKVLYYFPILHLSQKLNNDFSWISLQIGDAQRKHSDKSRILSALFLKKNTICACNQHSNTAYKQQSFGSVTANQCHLHLLLFKKTTSEMCFLQNLAIIASRRITSQENLICMWRWSLASYLSRGRLPEVNIHETLNLTVWICLVDPRRQYIRTFSGPPVH